MIRITICQNENEILDRVISEAFKESKVAIECTHGSSCDICLLSSAGTPTHTDAKILIIPDTKQISTLNAQEVISYGLCCKNTLTVSSCIDNTLVISLQRKIRTLGDASIEEQDFSVKISDPDEPEMILAAIATLLVSDVPINVISSLPF